jgi:fructokinase
MDWYAGIETGGTKVNCIVANDPENVLVERTIPTLSPEKTIPEVISFFTKAKQQFRIEYKSVGIASFGPLNLDRSSLHFGTITTTPKTLWKDFPLRKTIMENLEAHVEIDTDVNAAALAEMKWGAAQGFSNLIYITIGTGIGAGIITNGNLIHGVVHPEVGHMKIQHDLLQDPFKGNCPFHKDCLEGLASGTSLFERWKISPEELPSTHVAWNIEANYLAQAIYNLSVICSPEKIILGGGLSNKQGVIEKTRSDFTKLLNNYLSNNVVNSTDTYIVHPKLGSRAGVFGAIALAQSCQ